MSRKIIKVLGFHTILTGSSLPKDGNCLMNASVHSHPYKWQIPQKEEKNLCVMPAGKKGKEEGREKEKEHKMKE